MAIPRAYLDKQCRCIRVENFEGNEISISEAHTFLREVFSAIYDYHKLFPKDEVCNCLREVWAGPEVKTDYVEVTELGGK